MARRGMSTFNACLDEALRRLDLMRESLAYAHALALPKVLGKKPNKERASAFAILRDEGIMEPGLEPHGFSHGGDSVRRCASF